MGTRIPKYRCGGDPGWFSRVYTGTKFSPSALAPAYLWLSGALWGPQRCSHISPSCCAFHHADSGLSDSGLILWPDSVWFLGSVQDGGELFLLPWSCCAARACGGGRAGTAQGETAVPGPDVQPPRSCCCAGLPQPGGDVPMTCKDLLYSV